MTLVTAIFLSILTVIFVCIWITVQGKYLMAAQSSRAQLATALMAQLAQQSLEDGNILRLAYMADRTAKSDMISRVMVADMTGEIIVDSRHLAYGTKPDVVRRAMTATNDEIQTDEKYWIETAGIRAESGRVLGCIVLEFPTQALARAQRHAWMVGVLVALLGVIIGSIIAFFAAYLITSPLERLLVGIRRLQAGEAGEPIPELGGHELAEIACAFNEMAGAVMERQHSLELLNQMAVSLPLASGIEEIASVADQYTQSIMGAGAYLWIVDQISRTLNPISPVLHGTTTKPMPSNDVFMVGQSFTDRRVIVAGEGSCDMPASSAVADGFIPRSSIALPLITPDGVAGVLVIADMKWHVVSAEDEAMARAIGNAVAPIVMSRLKIDAQVRTSAAMQSLLIPNELPNLHVDLYTAYAPAEKIVGLGGDYYDFAPLDDNSFAFVVGDTSGKGLEAARYTANAKYAIRSNLLEEGTPADALYRSNKVLIAQGEFWKFITVFCAVLDTSSGVMLYADAGHEPPLLYRSSSHEIEILDTTGVPLGAVPDAKYKNEQIELKSGDILCIYTDGIPEARHQGDWFGTQRLCDILTKMANQSCREIGERIMQDVMDFVGGGLRDDVVLVVLKMP